MNIKIDLGDGEYLDLTNYKGEFTYEGIKSVYGEEIADTIMKNNPYYKMGKAIERYFDSPLNDCE